MCADAFSVVGRVGRSAGPWAPVRARPCASAFRGLAVGGHIADLARPARWQLPPCVTELSRHERTIKSRRLIPRSASQRPQGARSPYNVTRQAQAVRTARRFGSVYDDFYGAGCGAQIRPDLCEPRRRAIRQRDGTRRREFVRGSRDLAPLLRLRAGVLGWVVWLARLLSGHVWLGQRL